MDPRLHRFAREQHVEVQDGEYPSTVEVVALLPGRCAEHDAPLYGCVHNGDHYSFCEEKLTALSPTNRSKLN